jgi:hypothetical protein
MTVLRERKRDVTGFDLHEVGRACTDHGWTVG